VNKMIKVNKGKNTLSLDFYTENPEGIIDEMESFGFECIYTTNGNWGQLIYPNYKDADEVVCNWVGVPTMIHFEPDHKYID
tara:strand:+ start:825 stop:1067 length:243 start_codon:yes stop_codon:yes gene_type:complete